METREVLQPAGQIRIINLPAGEAPASIRQAWVGLILPFSRLTQPNNGNLFGVVTGELSPYRGRSFIVPQEQALLILAQAKPTAARWWLDRGYPKTCGDFAFRENEAEILSQVI